MTARQITNKLKNNIDLEGLSIDRDQIEVAVGYEERNGRGFCDDEAVEQRCKEIAAVLPEFAGGFSTQYGAMILQRGYKVDTSDWNDASSPKHY